MPRHAFDGHARRVPLPDGLHLGELLEEGVVLLEALLGALEHLHRLVLADLLDELLEAVLAKFLRDGVRSPSLSLRVCSRTVRTTDKRRVCEGDGVGLVGGVELHLAGGRVVRPEREVDGLDP